METERKGTLTNISATSLPYTVVDETGEHHFLTHVQGRDLKTSKVGDSVVLKYVTTPSWGLWFASPEKTEDKIRCTGCDEFFSPDDIVFIWNDEKLCEECDVKRKINEERGWW